MNLSGKTVLVTGGGSGIGRLTALRCAEHGAEAVIWDLTEDTAKKVADEIIAKGGRARYFACNVADEDMVNKTAAETGPIDVLINNAGVVTGKNLLDASSDAIRRTFDVNVLAQFWTTRAFLPAMVERDAGAIVNIASMAGVVGVAKQTDYSASKFASFGFTESLRSDLRSMNSNVGTMVICPFYIDTGMFDGVTTKFPHLIPILKPDYVAKTIVTSLERGRQMVMIPYRMYGITIFRLLPTRLFDKIMDFTGTSTSMENFVGHQKK